MPKTSLKTRSVAWFAAAASSLAIALASTGPVLALDLATAVQSAVDNNPEVGVVAADRRAIEQELRQARSLWMPSLDLEADAGPQYTDNTLETVGDDNNDSETLFRYQASLTLTQVLFDAFERRSEIDRQLARTDSAARRVAEASEFMGLAAVEAYLNVLRQQEIVRQAETNFSEHERISGGVRELTDQGRGGVSDVRQAEARLASAEDVLVTAEGGLLDAKATFLKIVGLPAENLEDIAFPTAQLPDSPEEAARIARTDSPTVRILESDIDVARADLTGSRSGYYPKLNLEAGAVLGDNVDGVEGRNTNASALLVMRYNLFRGGADIAREREAYHRLNGSMVDRERAIREAEEEARLAYNALLTSRARTRTLASQTQANQLTRSAYGEEFQLGQRSLINLLDAQNEYFLSGANLATARRTEQFAAYRVLASTGRMLEALQIDSVPESVNIWREPVDDFREEGMPADTLDQPFLDGPPATVPDIPAAYR